MTARLEVTDSWIADIANPGFGPFFAVHVRADRRYVLTAPEALFASASEAQRLLARVREVGSINPDLWDFVDRTDAEREAHFGPGGDLWQWEEMEKANGNWDNVDMCEVY